MSRKDQPKGIRRDDLFGEKNKTIGKEKKISTRNKEKETTSNGWYIYFMYLYIHKTCLFLSLREENIYNSVRACSATLLT
jgi:hypothetical protein